MLHSLIYTVRVDLVGDDSYGAHHLPYKVGASYGIVLRLIEEQAGLEPDEVGLVLLEISFELFLGNLLRV